MLVLSRRECEQICFGNQIELTVVAITGGQVRLGIKAPRNVPIVRSELKTRPAAVSENDPALA